jgi:hypothetical protein
MPSVFADDPVASVGSVLVVPTAVDTQHPRIACAPSIANAVEELQNLSRASVPDPDGSFGASRPRKENTPIDGLLRQMTERDQKSAQEVPVQSTAFVLAGGDPRRA